MILSPKLPIDLIVSILTPFAHQSPRWRTEKSRGQESSRDCGKLTARVPEGEQEEKIE